MAVHWRNVPLTSCANPNLGAKEKRSGGSQDTLTAKTPRTASTFGEDAFLVRVGVDGVAHL